MGLKEGLGSIFADAGQLYTNKAAAVIGWREGKKNEQCLTKSFGKHSMILCKWVDPAYHGKAQAARKNGPFTENSGETACYAHNEKNCGSSLSERCAAKRTQC